LGEVPLSSDTGLSPTIKEGLSNAGVRNAKKALEKEGLEENVALVGVDFPLGVWKTTQFEAEKLSATGKGGSKGVRDSLERQKRNPTFEGFAARGTGGKTGM